MMIQELPILKTDVIPPKTLRAYNIILYEPAYDIESHNIIFINNINVLEPSCPQTLENNIHNDSISDISSITIHNNQQQDNQYQDNQQQDNKYQDNQYQEPQTTIKYCGCNFQCCCGYCEFCNYYILKNKKYICFILFIASTILIIYYGVFVNIAIR